MERTNVVIIGCKNNLGYTEINLYTLFFTILQKLFAVELFYCFVSI